MVHLGVELDGVYVFLCIFHGGHGAGIGGRHGTKALGQLLYVVDVAHPGGLFDFEPFEEFAGRIHHGLGLSEFPLVGFGDDAAEGFGDQLHAVADAEDGDAQFEDFAVDAGAGLVVYAVGAAGKDESDGFFLFDRIPHFAIADHFGVDVLFPYAPGDELIVLAAEVDDQNLLSVHG